MNLKIIIVSHEPLTKRTYAMFNIDGYFQKGFDVEYWNISELLGGISYLPNMTYFDFQKNIVTVKDLNKEVNITKGYSKCILILEFPLNWKIGAYYYYYQHLIRRCFKLIFMQIRLWI